MLQVYKPDSVSRLGRTLSFICDGCCQPPVSAYPGPSGEQPSSGPIHGISARKVYPLLPLPATTVGSYPTFSPLLCLCKHKHGGYFLWHFLVPVPSTSSG